MSVGHTGSVDWEAIGNPLPVEQIPRDKEIRRQIFAEMDVSNNGSLTLTEVVAGLPKLLEGGERKTGEKSSYLVPLDDLKKAAADAFKEAKDVAVPSDGKRRRLGDNCIDRREFHALLVAFMMHIELDVLFDEMDRDDDKRLHWLEVKKFADRLEPWNITVEQAQRKFPDDWTPALSYKKFKEWCILRRFHGGVPFELDENDPEATLKDHAGQGNLGATVKSFKSWDTDGSGTISQEELTTVLTSLDDAFTEGMAIKLMESIDANEDGSIDYLEFSNWLARGS